MSCTCFLPGPLIPKSEVMVVLDADMVAEHDFFVRWVAAAELMHSLGPHAKALRLFASDAATPPC